MRALREDFLHLIYRENIVRIAESAVQSLRFSVRDDIGKLLAAERDQGSGYPLTTAVASESNRHALKDMKVHVSQDSLKDRLRCLTISQKISHGRNVLQLLLEL